MEVINARKPDLVLLGAHWQNRLPSYEALDTVVKALKQAGVGRVVVMGMVPWWHANLPKLAYQYMRLNNLSVPPRRMKMGLLDEMREYDVALRRHVESSGVTYISPYDYFCNAQW
jgi:hypothetical protein